MKRDKIMRFRVDTKEADTIRQRAAQSGRSVSEYLRLSATNLFIHTPISPEITRAISRWSQNLNQLAFHANSTGELEIAAIRELKQEAIRILQAIEARK